MEELKISQTSRGDVEAIIQAVGDLGQVHYVEGVPILVHGAAARATVLERLGDPMRIHACLTTDRVDGLAAYLKAFAADASPLVFAWGAPGDACTYRVRAVFDYHTPREAQWCSHRIDYAPRVSAAWAAWHALADRNLSQSEWLEHLEENAPELSAPPDKWKGPKPTELLALAERVQIKRTSSFESAHRLADGRTELTITEGIEAGTARGRVEMPDRFWLKLPIFIDGPPVYVLCWLRTRVADGRLVIRYTMHRAHEAIDVAWESILGDVEKAAAAAKCAPVIRAVPDESRGVLDPR